MNRGEIWTLQDTSYASKARPVVVVQNDQLQSFDSVVLCLFTTFNSDDIPTRVRIEPSEENGLSNVSYVMTDKIVTVSANALGTKIGFLNDEYMKMISQKLLIVLDLAQ